MLGGGKLFEKSFSSHLVMPNNQAPLISKTFEMGDNGSFLPQHLLYNLIFLPKVNKAPTDLEICRGFVYCGGSKPRPTSDCL